MSEFLDNDYRAMMTEHYTAIAQEMHRKRIRRAPWRIEVDGCVYKFEVTMYAKKGSPRDLEYRARVESLDGTPE